MRKLDLNDFKHGWVVKLEDWPRWFSDEDFVQVV